MRWGKQLCSSNDTQDEREWDYDGITFTCSRTWNIKMDLGDE